MTNFSLWDVLHKDVNPTCDRYEKVNEALSLSSDIDVEKAFEILESVQQKKGEWVTALSMVYSKNDNTVYYCLNGDFDKRYEYKFPM